MGVAGRLVDALGIYLTGGSSNGDPVSSLGGQASSTLVRGLGALLSTPIPGIRVDNVYPACGEGDANLYVDPADDSLYFTPPSGAKSDALTILASEEKTIADSGDANKAIRIYRDSTYSFIGNATLSLVNIFNGVLSMSDVTSAQRAAGHTTYRALIFKAQGAYSVKLIKLWMPPVSGSQATFSLALETPVGDTIQTIANETTAPTSVSWVTPTVEGSALEIPLISMGNHWGLWIRRVFPGSGIVDAQEDFQLAMKYEGA